MIILTAMNDYRETTRFVFGCEAPAQMLKRQLLANGFSVSESVGVAPARSPEEIDRAVKLIKSIISAEAT